RPAPVALPSWLRCLGCVVMAVGRAFPHRFSGRNRRGRRAAVVLAGVIVGGVLTAFTPAISVAPPAPQLDKDVPVHSVTGHYHALRQAPAWHAQRTTWPTGAASVAIDGVTATRAGTL